MASKLAVSTIIASLSVASTMTIATIVAAPAAARETTYQCPNNPKETCHKPPCNVGDTAQSDTLPDGTTKERECVMALRAKPGARIDKQKLPAPSGGTAEPASKGASKN